MTEKASHPLVYLIKARRFTVLRHYAAAFDGSTIKSDVFVELLSSIDPESREDMELLDWILERADISSDEGILLKILKERNGVRLLQHILGKIDLLDTESIRDHYRSEPNLLDTYIVYMKSEPSETIGYSKSLIHELLKSNNLKSILALKDVANQDQWSYLTSVRTYAMELKVEQDVNVSDESTENAAEEQKQDGEGAATDSDKTVRPFFLALSLGQVEVCSVLMPSIQDIKAGLTQTEIKVLSDYLKSASILSFKRGALSRIENPQIALFNSLVYTGADSISLTD